MSRCYKSYITEQETENRGGSPIPRFKWITSRITRHQSQAVVTVLSPLSRVVSGGVSPLDTLSSYTIVKPLFLGLPLIMLAPEAAGKQEK
jgi:hypothetical protein